MGLVRKNGVVGDAEGGGVDGFLGINLTDGDFGLRAIGLWMPVPKRKLLTADAAVVGATLTTVAGLAVPITANGIYYVRWVLPYTTTSTTVNFDLLQTTFTSSQTATSITIRGGGTAPADSQIVKYRTGTTTLGTAAGTATITTTAVNLFAYVDAFIVATGTGGTLNLQIATAAAQTITVRKGAFVEWNRTG